PAQAVPGARLRDCCRYYEFQIVDWDESEDRTRLQARVAASGSVRPFFGFNRAMFAVLEAAILTSRVHLLGRDSVLAQLDQLTVLVDKTGSAKERQAFELLRRHVGVGS